jgi:hypothetical protein
MKKMTIEARRRIYNESNPAWAAPAGNPAW